MQTLPSEPFVSRVKAKLLEFPGGEKLLARLEQTGCGVTFILIFLELYCGAQVESPRRESIKIYGSEKKSLAKELVKLSDQLTKTALGVEKANAQAAQQLARHGQEPFLLPARILAYVSQIVAASVEIGEVSLRTEPMDALNCIADCLKGPGGRIDYDNLALLLGAGYAACGVTRILSPADVKRLVKRARNRRAKLVRARPIAVHYPPGFGGS